MRLKLRRPVGSPATVLFRPLWRIPTPGNLWRTVITGTSLHFSVAMNSFAILCRLPFLSDRQRFTRLLNPEGFALAKTLTKTKTKTLTKPKKASSAIATIDNRKGVDRRIGERRKETVAVASERRVGQRREKVNRRRQIDPTTCERDYTDAEVEFMHALDQYKRTSGRMFPTCSEVLEVLISLGYEKNPASSGALSGTPKHSAPVC